MAEASHDSEAFVTNLTRGMAAHLEGSDFREGCPIATTALEIATDSETIGKAARDAFVTWEREIAQRLSRFGVSARKADRLATAILSQLEGALLMARTYRNLEPMYRAKSLRLLVKLTRQAVAARVRFYAQSR